MNESYYAGVMRHALDEGHVRIFDAVASTLGINARGESNPTAKYFQPYNVRSAKEFISFSVDFYTQKLGKRPTSFIDVGCGMGDKCLMAQDLKLKATGLELCDDFLRVCKLVSPKSTFLKTDIREYEYYDSHDIFWIFNPTLSNGEWLIEHILEQIKHPVVIMHLNTDLPQPLPDPWRLRKVRTADTEHMYKTYYETAILVNF